MSIATKIMQAMRRLFRLAASSRCGEAVTAFRLRWENSLALQLYTMLLPLAVSAVWVGMAAWNGLQQNAGEVLEAGRIKEDLRELHALMLTQSDASKAMILHPEDNTSGTLKIQAYDAHESLLVSLLGRTKSMPTIHRGLMQLRLLDDGNIKPADTEIVEALAAGNTKRAQVVHGSRYGPAKKRYEACIRQMIDDAERGSQTASTLMKERNAASLFHIGLALICGFGSATVALVMLLRRRILMPLAAIRDGLSRVSAGDFGVQLASGGDNELGQTSRAVNHMVHSVRNSMSGMATESKKVAAQSDRLQAISGSMVLEAQEVAQSFDTLSLIGSEFAVNVREASDYLKTISESVDGVSSSAQESAQRISSAQELSHRTSEAVQGLKQSTVDIDEIVDFIVRLTFETNILALNATIEAARHGDSGAGFRVIAQQVKNLADQTKSAAAQISGHVTKMGRHVKESTAAMSEMKQLFDCVTDISSAVAEGTATQSRATQSLNQTVSVLASSGEHIAESLSKMVFAIEQTHSLASSTRESSVEVSTSSAALDRLLSRFESEEHLT